jgi:hypothetical protein
LLLASLGQLSRHGVPSFLGKLFVQFGVGENLYSPDRTSVALDGLLIDSQQQTAVLLKSGFPFRHPPLKCFLRNPFISTSSGQT